MDCRAADPPARTPLPGVGTHAGHVDVVALVRSLQRTAGLKDCFRIGKKTCDVETCTWREHCLGMPAAPPPPARKTEPR